MVVCSSIPPADGHKSVCCVINYNFQGEEVGSVSCIPIGGGFLAADCTRMFDFTLLGGEIRQKLFGRVADCCHDCVTPEKKLVLSGGRLVRNGGAFATSPEDEPDKCCCGGECVCKDVPDCAHVRCYSKKDPTPDDKCKARCVIKTYDDDGHEVIDDRQAICATITQCCAEDNTTCEATCKDGEFLPGGSGITTTIPPANDWTIMPCTDCAVCCEHNYDENPESPTFRQSLGKTGRKDIPEDECKANRYFMLDPANPLGPRGVWHNGTDNLNICNPPCCQDLIRGDEKETRCAPTSATVCDPCIGRCIEVEYEDNPAKCPRAECKTKQECCGDGGEKCEPQCGEADAKYRWEEGCGDGSKCGTCCQAIYNNEGAVIELTCDEDTTTLDDCERLVAIGNDPSGNPLPDSAYGSWFPFGTCAECNATPCCREITCEDGSTDTICATVAAADCDFCNGTCLEIETGNKTCAHYTACCGADGEKCESFCDNVATHSWSDNGCTDPELCGACCRVVYDGTTALEATCVESITKESDCKLTEEDEAQQIEDGHVISYTWKPFKNCESAKCDTKRCCGEKCEDDVGCIDVDLNDSCDPCKGRCYNVATETASCKTKQECCGDNGAKCRGCPGTGEDGGGATAPEFEWSGCFENGQLCGICCVITLDAAGDPVSSECEEGNYKACIDRGANASWKAFESCGSAICIPASCCNDEICPGQTICLAVDKDRGACADPCRGECYAIDETGAEAGDSFCATKVDCCGEQNEKCTPVAGFCPDGNTVPTHSWPNDCADGELCGVCCKKNLNADGSLAGLSCDDTKDNQADCEAANFGFWYPFGTCAACGDTKQACVETKCKKIVTVDGVDQEISVTTAACKPVSADKTNCNGICTELATATRPYAVTTCKTKDDCCGADGSKCRAVGCGAVVTHAFNNSCLDGEKCGVCCIVTNMGDGKLTPGAPQVNTGREACEDLNTATPRFGVGNTTTWIPFGGTGDCDGTPCATLCPDGSAQCINKLAPEVCPEPCNGLCQDVDGTVSLKTKTDCCVVDGVNLCALNDARCSKPTWTVVCAESADKCGVACKTTYNAAGTAILDSECVAGITTKTAMDLAQAGAPAGVVYTWHPWDTCESVICRPKICCGTICTDANGNDVIGCKTVDYNDECDSCRGICYSATYDSDDNRVYKNADAVGECSTLIECCGAIGERCSRIDACPVNDYKVYEPCDAENCETTYGCPCLVGENLDRTPRVNFAANTKNIVNALPPGLRGSPLRFDFAGATGNCMVQTSLQFCPNGCSILATAQWNWCVDPATGFPPPQGPNPVTFKNCYPQAINNEPTYLYIARRATGYIRNDGNFRVVPEAENFEFTVRSEATKVAVYACRDDKLVDVTEELFDVQPIELCVEADRREASRLNFDNVLSNYAVTAISYGLNRQDGRGLYAHRTSYSATEPDELIVGSCESAYDDLTEPELKNCPQAFTENPLP
jgi:hypothetical protein